MSPATIFDVDELRRRVTGDVVTPSDDHYDQARRMFYGGLDNRPAALVKVVDANDVAAVIGYARETGIELAVRSGGHNLLGHSGVDGGLVIDLRALKSLEIDLDSATAWAGTGLTAGEFTDAVGEHGYAVGFGDTGSVGIGGITLGGGVGFLSRKHGLTIDSVRAAEIVTAEGEVLDANAESHPDLFWAIRGGGGNFGVVTRFEYELHELGQVVGGLIILPATVEVVDGFLDLSSSAPDELSTIANVMSAPPMPFLPDEMVGTTVLMGLIVWSGGVEEGRAWMDRFRNLAEPLFDMLDEMPYPQIFMPEDEDFQPTAAARTGFAETVGTGQIAQALAAIEAFDAPMRVVQIRALGGAIARVANDATAYAHRDRRMMINVAAFYESEEERKVREAWVRDLSAVMMGDDTAGYVGFVTSSGPEAALSAYPGDTFERLRQVKEKYDPDNVFHRNQNIPPA